MIRIQCPNCSCYLNAKPSLAGQVRKCPTCKHPIQIPADGAQPPSAVMGNLAQPPSAVPDEIAQPRAATLHPSDAADPDFIAAVQERLPAGARLPDRLDRENLYLICGKAHLAAKWENDGRGWMIRGAGGFVNARRNRDVLPAEGDFTLVELLFDKRPEGKRLVGIVSYRLVQRWALTVLDESDDAIVAKITEFGTLNREQKHLVRLMLKEHFMREVWDQATEVLDYLADNDFHSPGVGRMERPKVEEIPRVGIADFLGAAVFVDNRIPRGFDFAFHVFRTYNPRAAQILVERKQVGNASIESQYLGAMGVSGPAFVKQALQLARDEAPGKGLTNYTMIVQENVVALDAGGQYHTVLCSYFKSQDAREIVLKPGESLDGLLR